MIPLEDIARRFHDRPLFSGDSLELSYAEFLDTVNLHLREKKMGGGNMSVPMDWTVSAFARLCASLLSGTCVFPGEPFPAGELEPFMDRAPLLILKTGGSTGRPRHAVHSMETFLGRYSIREKPPHRQLILYSPGHIAGLDAFFHALFRGATVVLPQSRLPEGIVSTLETQGVDVLAATPTQLQFLLLADALSGRKIPNLKSIPYGAERMSESLRERLGTVFTRAKVIQRFGMTELGTLPVVEDPENPGALFLEVPNHTWKVEHGELHVWAPGRMLGTLEEGPLPDDPWFRTGDLAERTASGSIRILGRKEKRINVGGLKIIPAVVEELLMEQPDIADAHVYAIPNPMTGQAVAARIVYRGHQDLVDILKRLRIAGREKDLPLACVPTRIEFVDQVEVGPSGKRVLQA